MKWKSNNLHVDILHLCLFFICVDSLIKLRSFSFPISSTVSHSSLDQKRIITHSRSLEINLTHPCMFRGVHYFFFLTRKYISEKEFDLFTLWTFSVQSIYICLFFALSFFFIYLLIDYLPCYSSSFFCIVLECTSIYIYSLKINQTINSIATKLSRFLFWLFL